MEIVYKDGVYLPQIKLWLDPHDDKPGESAFVSHAHGDHAKWSGLTYATAPTLRFMRTRHPMPTGIEAKAVAYQNRVKHEGATLTLLPAGHIAGSAQLLVEYKDERLIYSGDFKMRPDSACEPIVMEEADDLIMETTFGRPNYLFPPASKTIERVALWCKAALRDRKIPVLMAYSLGKAQELMLALKPWDFHFVLHPAVADMVEVYKGLGYSFPPHAVPGNTGPEGKIVIWPPNARNHPFFAQITGKARTAYISGWAMDASAKARFKTDEAFPLSDHADFSELIAYVWQVHPKRIHTHHGFAAEFASHLRLTGHDARALGEVEQLELI